eukprot:403370255
MSKLLKKYKSTQQCVKFDIIYDVTCFLMMTQYIFKVANLILDMNIKSKTLVINKNTSDVGLKDLFLQVNGLKISEASYLLFYASIYKWNFGHIKRMNLQNNGIFPFPPMFEDLETLIIVDYVEFNYFYRLEETIINYWLHIKASQQNKLPASASLKTFTEYRKNIMNAGQNQYFRKQIDTQEEQKKISNLYRPFNMLSIQSGKKEKLLLLRNRFKLSNDLAALLCQVSQISLKTFGLDAQVVQKILFSQINTNILITKIKNQKQQLIQIQTIRIGKNFSFLKIWNKSM